MTIFVTPLKCSYIIYPSFPKKIEHIRTWRDGSRPHHESFRRVRVSEQCEYLKSVILCDSQVWALFSTEEQEQMEEEQLNLGSQK